MNELVIVALLALTPIVELRGSIPYGIAVGLNPALVVLVSIIFNVLAAPFAYAILAYVVGLFQHISWFHRFWQRIILRSQHKVRPAIDRYGVPGLALFIGVPLPGTGVYTGTIGAYALGFTLKQISVASVIGVCIAAALVSTAVLVGKEAWLFITN